MKRFKRSDMKHFWTPNAFIRNYAKKLTACEQMVYISLRCYAGGKDDKTFVAGTTIAKKLNYNHKTVYQAFSKLENFGLIKPLGKKNRCKIWKINHFPNTDLNITLTADTKEYIKKEYLLNKNNSFTSLDEIINKKPPYST